jgi:hypothetical protein
MAYKAPFATGSDWGIMQAGTGLTVTDGIVDVTASPSGLLDVGYFYSTVNQTNPVAGDINIVTVNGTTLSKGVTVLFGTEFTVAKTGNYTLNYTIQFIKTSGGAAANIDVWLRLNGADVADSNSNFTISNNNAAQVVAANYTLSMTSGQYLQLAWQSTSANAELLAVPAQVGPIRPASPSVRVTLLQV